MNYRNEAFPAVKGVDLPRLHYDRNKSYTLTDQLQASITLNVMAERAFVADELANEVFLNLSGFREWFKEKGIHKYTGLGIGREANVKISSADIEVSNVSVQLSFLREESITLGERLFNARVYKDNKEIFEGIDFEFKGNGSQVLMQDADTSASYTIDYIDAITLEEKTNIDLISDESDNKLYTVADNGVVYGYYDLFETFKAYKEDNLWIEEKN